jgi:hypothetical protein
MRCALVALLAVLVLAAPGCGGDDAQRAVDRAREGAERAVGADALRERVKDLRAEAERLRTRARNAREELGRRVREILDQIEQSVPRASLPPPSAQGRTAESEIARYLDEVLGSIDRYWTQTLRANGLPAPQVKYYWVPQRSASRTGCQSVADDNAAFYCPADDTIYVAEKLASDLYRGIADQFPGERAGAGNAIGDFGLAYVVAHEYAHNVQFELGFYELAGRQGSVEPFELQADCMAGLWGNAVYREGRYDKADVQDAISTAQAAGDFDYGNPQHHGTPAERRAAWLTGFQSGEPAQCRQFVPGT